MEQWLNKIHIGNVMDVLKKMPDGCVHCVVTSPPYWGLRDYGLEPVVWDGEEGCIHDWGEEQPAHHLGQVVDSKAVHNENAVGQNKKSGQFCFHCGAWRGSLGLEPTPELYVKHLVDIFIEVKRVLRNDGILWLNLGDSYAGSGGAHSEYHTDPGLSNSFKRQGVPHWGELGQPGNYLAPQGMKAKDLVGIPWLVAFALRTDGWYLRSCIPWFKRNAMPESVTDRPTTSVEDIFLLSKEQTYFYDGEAVKVCTTNPNGGIGPRKYSKVGLRSMSWGRKNMSTQAYRNLRNADFFFQTWQGLWENEESKPLAFIVNPYGFKEAHFATFPEKLVEPMIKAGTSEKGCCPKCGSSWRRIGERSPTENTQKMCDGLDTGSGSHGTIHRLGREEGNPGQPIMELKTIGWKPTCSCYNVEIIEDPPQKPSDKYKNCIPIWSILMDCWNFQWRFLKPIYSSLPVVSCVVLDPFMGSGVTGKVATRFRRNWIGIDLKPEYGEMTERRISGTQIELF